MANVHDEVNSWGIINNDKPTCFFCSADIVKESHKKPTTKLLDLVVGSFL